MTTQVKKRTTVWIWLDDEQKAFEKKALTRLRRSSASSACRKKRQFLSSLRCA